MIECEEKIKLTNENWDKITLQTYNIAFLNDRNAIRAVLYELLQIDNEIKSTNVEINNLKSTFDSQLLYFEDEIKRYNENEYLEPEDKNESIAEIVKKIEETNASFAEEIEKFQLIKEEKCAAISTRVEKLFQLKSQFRFTHEDQVECLKRFRMFCSRDIREAVDIRMKSVDRKFCDEFFYISSCEKGLKHIFTLIDDKSSHSEVCPSTTTTSDSQECLDFFTDFAWMRNEQLTKRTELYDFFQKYMARDLVQGLAAIHVYKPDEPIKFLANFLKNLKKNEFRLKKQELIFAAAKTNEELFPN